MGVNPLFIAEIGLNHGGDFLKAIRMIDKAKEAGADIAKFQYYIPIKVLGPDSPYLEYANNAWFTQEQHNTLAYYCHITGIEYMVSVFDIVHIPWADSLNKRHKVASRMNRDQMFMQLLALSGKPVIISIQPGVIDYPIWPSNISYMWCVTDYPTDPKKFEAFIYSDRTGLSSHCPSIIPTVDAYKKGARTFENHVCENRDEKGCDISSSLTFEEYAQMVKAIRG